MDKKMKNEWIADNLARIEGLTAASGRTDLKDILIELQQQIIALRNIVMELKNESDDEKRREDEEITNRIGRS